MPINLVIKSATQVVEDFSLECELSWTIGQIKDHLAETYPTKPKKEQQKLIYGGKLLPDHLALKSILNHSQDRHTIHLVCPAPPKSLSQNQSKEQVPVQSFPVPPTNPDLSPIGQPVLNPQGFSGLPPMNMAAFAAPGDAFQQYLAMQQMYAQIMTQYMSQYNGVGAPPVIPYGPATYIPANQTPAVPAPQQNVQANQVPQRDNEDNHEFLDYLYIFSRAVILFALLFYYSSIHRVLLVLCAVLFVSFYISMHREEQQRQAIERQRNRDSAAQPGASDIQQAGTDENVPDTTTSTDSAPVTQQAEARSLTSYVSLTVSIISSFFSSLIPTDPVPLNVN